MASRMRVVRRGADSADDLYTVPPSDFTRIRDALVRTLRSAGQESIANAVRQRRKPTVAVWALNQAARKAPGHVQILLSALDRVKRAQLRQPGDLAPASDSMRAAVARIVSDARNALQSTGTAWSPSLLRRVADTLRGAASDPAQRDQLLHGRLTDESTAPGFDVFGDAKPSGKLRAVKPTKERPTTNPRIERDDMMRRRAAELERESQEREREAARAEDDAHQARARLRDLEERAKSARRKATEASRTSVKAVHRSSFSR